ncbi:MAG: hypothetical protein EYC70_05110 [Planctomycetota bacterium]|nr:MAG: hypothetical protein EYC70_05110 [Planctomycetota bacterium]
MASRSPVLLYAGCLALGGVAGGVLGQALLAPARQPPPVPAPAVAATRSAEELELLQRLAAAMDRLAAALAAAPAERRDFNPPADPAPELALVLQELRALARGSMTRAGAPEAPLPVFNTSLEPDRAALAPLYEQDYDARYRAHRYWTTDQVLDRYGVPDYMLPQDAGVLRWAYEDPVTENWMEFDFYQGIVIRVDG